jgi:hypothetical protein
VAGRLASQQRLAAGLERESSARQLLTAWQEAASGTDPGQPVGQAVVDEIAIIGRWLYLHQGSPAIVSLPDDPSSLTGWLGVVDRLPPLALVAAPASSPRRLVVEVDPDTGERFAPE